MNLSGFVSSALSEDVGRGDLYGRVASSQSYCAVVKSNSSGVLAGQPYVLELCSQNSIDVEFFKQDGGSIAENDILAKVSGSNIDILRCERTILNILQHASGIASNVARYASIAAKFNVMLLDTRKTRPLLREFEKYSARIGGAVNHRFGLDDALMIKDTHRKSIDNLVDFIDLARKKIPFTAKIELECESLEDALEAFCLDIDILMCDNMSTDDVAAVVAKKQELVSKILIEASGGINIHNLENYCKSGVDAISIGSAIHQATWLDFSMKGVV